MVHGGFTCSKQLEILECPNEMLLDTLISVHIPASRHTVGMQVCYLQELLSHCIQPLVSL